MGRRCTYGMPEKECLRQEAGQLYYEDDEGNRHKLDAGLMETELAASVCSEEDPVFTNIRWFAQAW